MIFATDDEEHSHGRYTAPMKHTTTARHLVELDKLAARY